jgi:hypothetical protein
MLTPADVAQRRRLADALGQQGSDASPVGPWTQALARVLQGGTAGYYDARASQGEKEGIASRGAFMTEAMKNPSAAVASGIANPWTTDMAGDIGGKLISQKVAQSDPMYALKRQQAQAEIEMLPLKRQAMELENRTRQRDLDSPAAKLTVVPEGGILVGTDPRSGQHQEIARGNDKTKVPPGYRPTSEGNLEAIPGGPADIKINEKRQQDYAQATAMTQQLDELAKSVNTVLTAPGLDKNFGVQGYVPNIPGGKAANAQALLDTLRTQGAFAALQEMRNASKTGGALGAVSDKESVMLQNAIAALQRVQSADQARKQLQVFLDHIEASKSRIRNAYNDHWNRAGEASKRVMGEVPTIRDDSDYNRLPSGARFVDPDGKERIKP